MKMQFSVSLVILLIVLVTRGQGQLPKQCWSSQGSVDPYFLGNGFTCCNNIYLEHPLQAKNQHWRKCLRQQNGGPEDDLPTTLWNTYLCELQSAGMFSGGRPTYKEFEAFYFQKYPKDVKGRLLAKNLTCEVAQDAEIGTLLEGFEECFWNLEKQFCLGEGGIVSNLENHDANDRACEPVEKLQNPNHSFMTFAQPCCKGQELPYPLFDVFMDFDRFEIAEDVMTCAERLKSRVKELSPQTPLLMTCEVACVHEADGFDQVGKYNSKFLDLLNFKLKSVSNSVKSILMDKITKYNPDYTLWGSNQTVPMFQAGDLISTQDELSQIVNYCKFHYEATAEAYRALYEYCYNEEYGIQFREDILKSTSGSQP